VDILDLCSDWLESRSASYLCRENSIVYYASLTGRAGDYEWISLTLPEAIRIIRATKLQPEEYDTLSQSVLITACQELGRVYEFGAKSRFKTVPEVFNYLLEANASVEEDAMMLLSDELVSQGFSAMLCLDLTTAYDSILKVLGEQPVSPTERNRLILKHLPKHGYSIRVGTQRVQVAGKKERVILMAGKTGKDVQPLSKTDLKHLVARVAGALK
jgi:hypothetical protein